MNDPGSLSTSCDIPGPLLPSLLPEASSWPVRASPWGSEAKGSVSVLEDLGEAEVVVPGDLPPGKEAAALEVPGERLKQEAPGFRATLTKPQLT
jgi:hypothetical protein